MTAWLAVCSGVSCPCVLGVGGVGSWVRVRDLESGKVGVGPGDKETLEVFLWESPPVDVGSLSLGHRDRPLTASLLSSFPYTAPTDASPGLCAPSTGWDVPWILMLLFTAGQAFAVLVLSIMLWRRRAQGAQCRGRDPPPPTGGRREHLGARRRGLTLPLYPIFSRGGEGREGSSGLSGDCLPHSMWLLLPRCLGSSVQT